MEQHRIVTPGSNEWFKTVSFGDAIKLVAFAGTVVIAFTTLKTDLAHETEMRVRLEASTHDLMTEMRQAQKDNSNRTDQRFAENAQRDRELMGEVKQRMDRLESKGDQLISVIPRATR